MILKKLDTNYPDVSLELKALQGFVVNFENRKVGHFSK